VAETLIYSYNSVLIFTKLDFQANAQPSKKNQLNLFGNIRTDKVFPGKKLTNAVTQRCNTTNDDQTDDQ
jgi:hypothetical protein